MEDTMDEIAFQGAQKRIDFLGRWALALFAAFAVLVGWLGARYEAEQFGVVFWLGVAGIVAVIIIGGGCTAGAHLLIKRMEGHRNV